MLAIQWHLNVDFELGGLYIEKQITFDEFGNKSENEFKTEASEGYIPMPKWYMDALKKYHLEWKKEKLLCKDAF